jgi:hypothetical protein
MQQISGQKWQAFQGSLQYGSYLKCFELLFFAFQIRTVPGRYGRQVFVPLISGKISNSTVVTTKVTYRNMRCLHVRTCLRACVGCSLASDSLSSDWRNSGILHRSWGVSGVGVCTGLWTSLDLVQCCSGRFASSGVSRLVHTNRTKSSRGPTLSISRNCSAGLGEDWCVCAVRPAACGASPARDHL